MIKILSETFERNQATGEVTAVHVDYIETVTLADNTTREIPGRKTRAWGEFAAAFEAKHGAAVAPDAYGAKGVTTLQELLKAPAAPAEPSLLDPLL